MPDRFVDQAGAIPYRVRDGVIEVCIVTARSGGWTVPKGGIDPGHTPQQMAGVEALEEAGVIGEVEDEPFGEYEYSRGDKHMRVELYPMLVDRVLERWDEMDSRDREWLAPDEAAERDMPDGLTDVLRRFSAERGA